MKESGGPFSAKDRKRIAAEGLTLAEVDRQLALFQRGVSPVRLNRPCRVRDGIVLLSPAEEDEFLAVYEGALRTKRFMKFVPASGAASRMFKDWHRGLREGGFAEPAEQEAFIRNLRQYPFFPDLRAAVAAKGREVDDLIGEQAVEVILKFILTEEGLNYGWLPKALLKFHVCSEGCRTALEEHLVEAALYARDAQGCSRIHFTVSGEHENSVRERLSQVIPRYESGYETVYEIGLSTQETATNTLAVSPELRPFRDEKGELIFRPGGHGALLTNLDALEAEIIFLKNIDNIAPDSLKAATVRWKKIMAGYLISLQEGLFTRLRLLETGEVGEAALEEIARFCREKIQLVLPPDFEGRSPTERRSFLFRKLDRPIRVCGMVKNEGEPGGGPFWVDDPDGKELQSLQIVEESQIDRNDVRQQAIWRSATHFNPVDLVCGVHDFRGRKFALTRFVDPALSMIARKSEKGKELLALEHPGLWNGSMAFWNTLFVEVPLTTFNPVKTVSDLLRTQHHSS
ncbi:MAG: DUF4301 family protein [Syntrophales bacterium]